MGGVSREMRPLLLMHVIGLTISIYIGIFINLYIWEGHKRIFDVSWYNLFMYMTWGAAFTLGAHLLTRHSLRFVFALSASSGLMLFLLLSLLHGSRGLLGIAAIGACSGLTFGLFYAGQNLSLSLSAKTDNYGPYFAAMQTIQQIMSFAVPVVSGFIIQWLGYGASFFMMLAIIISMLLNSRYVPELSLAEINRVEPWYTGIRYGAVFDTAKSRWLLAAFFSAGLFFQFQNLLVPLFTFHLTENKLLIALLSCSYTLCALAALLLYRRLKMGEDFWMLGGAALVTTGFAAAAAGTASWMIVSNILSTVGMFYFSTQWLTKVFRNIYDFSPLQKMRVLIWRECMLCFSRCIMLVLTMFLEDIRGTVFVLLILLTVASMFTVPYCFRQSGKQLAGGDGTTGTAGGPGRPEVKPGGTPRVSG